MLSYNNKFFIKIFLITALICGSLFFSQVKATDENGSIGITITVPNAPPSGGGNEPPIQPPANDPPTITNVTSNTTETTATVSWTASADVTVTTFVLGETQAYELGAKPTVNNAVSLSGLTANTLYYYKITVTDGANPSVESTGSFTTQIVPLPLDTTPPVISNVVVSTLMTSMAITFTTDENAIFEIDYGLTTNYGSKTLDSNATKNHQANLIGLSPNTTYYYRIVVTDSSGNSAKYESIFKTLSDTIPPANVIFNQIIIESSALVLDWENPTDSDFFEVKILRKIGSSASGLNDLAASQIYQGAGENYSDSTVQTGKNYFYTIFSFDQYGNHSTGVTRSAEIVVAPVENCANNLDDDGDGLIDCADADCVLFESCATEIPPVPSTTIPIPLPTSTEPIIIVPNGPEEPEVVVIPAPVSTVPEFEKLTLSDFKFFSGSHQIELTPFNNSIFGLAKSNFSIGIKENNLPGAPVNMILTVNGQPYQFFYNENSKTYFADLLFPDMKKAQALLEIDYGAGQIDSFEFYLERINHGKVVDSDGMEVVGAEVTLFKNNGEKFLAPIFGQFNPIITNQAGAVGWMVPNGSYYIFVKKDGFYDFRGQNFTVVNNVVNNFVSLIRIPPKLLDVIKDDESVAQNVVNVAKNLSEKSAVAARVAIRQAQDVGKAVQEVATDPVVKEIATTVVAPSTVGVVAVGTIALVSWADILPLLRFLFLQPVLFFGRGKREKWGVVYHSLSKMPVDLAIVRLIDVVSGKILQTKVTSSDGRYYFVVNVGKYRLEVKKGNFVFPSGLLNGIQVDGMRADIYHGENIEVSQKGSVLTANIPLDPAGEKIKTPARLRWIKILRGVQNVLGWVGIAITIISLYISPVWYMWVLLGVHLLLIVIFRRLSKPPVSRGWGIVYDENTKKPLSRVVARLFDSRFNKLVASEVTDNDGKYYFMAGDNEYYIAYERAGYEPLKTEIIDLKGKPGETVARDVNLKKK